MAEFQVTATELMEKAELLQQLNERYARKVQELILAQQRLSASWEGAGRAAFDRVFQEDRRKLELFRQTVGEYCQALQQIIAGYEQAESRSIGIVGTRGY